MSSQYTVEGHKLVGKGVKFTASPNHGGAFPQGVADTLVIHFTAGSNLQSSVNTLCEPDGVSAHLVVGRDGSVVQLVPFDVVAWHAGASSWKGRSGLNKYSIGIELDNAGELNMTADGQFTAWFGTHYPADQVFRGVHRNQREPSYWHTYTDVQISTVFALCKTLARHYGMRDVVGHEEIAPSRKVDPGPAFPLDRLRQHVLADRAEDGNDPLRDTQKPKQVLATALNVRVGPGTDFGKAAPPIKRGQAVKVLESRDGWSQIEFTARGWVANKFIG